VKHDPTLHGEKRKVGDTFTQAFLRKYVNYAKRKSPKLSNAASERISKLYVELRSYQDIAGGALPVTPRTLETIVRLSTAHCKLRLANLVEVRDVEVAYRIMLYALTNDTPIDPCGLHAIDEEGLLDVDSEGENDNQRGNYDDDDDDDDDDEDDDDAGDGNKRDGGKYDENNSSTAISW
jgi:DNA replication licensing factor MCM3